MPKQGLNVGWVSTRFNGTDGVSLEERKWTEVLQSAGHDCFWFAGELDRPPDKSYLVPEAHFKHPDNITINESVYGRKGRTPQTTYKIHKSREHLKDHLHAFINKFSIEMLIAENCLTIPMHVPLGLALTEAIAETQIPTIAHHHDFYWERTRFFPNCIGDYLDSSFPPRSHAIKHVVINSLSAEQLALRKGLTSKIIPNVLDFDNPPEISPHRKRMFKHAIDLAPDDVIILQPTRVVQRKGIEYAIELIHQLQDSRYKLVISHDAGDEGYSYMNWLVEHAKKHEVDIRFVTSHAADPWNKTNTATLWDLYPFADFITYPSLQEGFGNAFLEAVYFKKPVLINRYETFIRDIEPLGFDVIAMDGFLDDEKVDKVREVLENEKMRKNMVETNYQIAQKHFSYRILETRLDDIMRECFSMPKQEQPLLRVMGGSN